MPPEAEQTTAHQKQPAYACDLRKRLFPAADRRKTQTKNLPHARFLPGEAAARRHRAARPEESGETRFFRQATDRMLWNAQRFKLKTL